MGLSSSEIDLWASDGRLSLSDVDFGASEMRLSSSEIDLWASDGRLSLSAASDLQCPKGFAIL